MRNTNASKDSAANSSFLVLHSSLILVFEMADSRNHHRDAMFVAIVERKLILNGATRLNNCGHTFISGNLHTVREGEESVSPDPGKETAPVFSAFFLYRRSNTDENTGKRTDHLQCGFRTQYGCSLYHYAGRWNCPGKKVY